MGLFQCSHCLQKYTFEEYLRLEKQSIDNLRQNVEKTMICKCGKPFLVDKWHLKTKTPSNHTVSTVHLEIAHKSNIDLSSEQTMWYETVIIDKNGDRLDFQARYQDKQAAQEGHELTVKLLPRILESPEKFPTDIFAKLAKTMD